MLSIRADSFPLVSPLCLCLLLYGSAGFSAERATTKDNIRVLARMTASLAENPLKTNEDKLPSPVIVKHVAARPTKRVFLAFADGASLRCASLVSSKGLFHHIPWWCPIMTHLIHFREISAEIWSRVEPRENCNMKPTGTRLLAPLFYPQPQLHHSSQTNSSFIVLALNSYSG